MRTSSLVTWAVLAPVIAAALAGCTVLSLREAPIVDKSARAPAPPAAVAMPVPNPTAAPALREARDGGYVVQRGDTLYSIALAFGQDYRDLARWNQLDDPARIRVGQTLRVEVPVEAAAGAVVATPVAASAPLESRPLDPVVVAAPSAPAGPLAPAATPAPMSAAPVAGNAAPTLGQALPTAPASPGPVVAVAPSLGWLWPADGKVIELFHETRNKGIDIGAAEGAPVLAANDGQVVYVGNGLRGYGNLLIIKHTDDFVSAYAHNRQIVVKQGEAVRRGQRVAEVGRTDADLPKLHFEIRRQGKPVDPLAFLPPR